MEDSGKRRKRRRIPRPKKFKAGDVFWADSTKGWHLTIILQNHTIENHQECIPICNFTGTPPSELLNYVIPISGYKLPSNWWTKQGQEKPDNWIVCQQIDCIKATDYSAESVLGNIKDDCPDLFELICEKTKQCLISPRLQVLCGCEDEEEIIFNDIDCGCNNIPNQE